MSRPLHDCACPSGLLAIPALRRCQDSTLFQEWPAQTQPVASPSAVKTLDKQVPTPLPASAGRTRSARRRREKAGNEFPELLRTHPEYP